MMWNPTPVLDPRDAAQVLDELLARRPAYVPDWFPVENGAARALLRIFARYMQIVTDRLNQAPDKNLLAFLDMLGINLIPARAARAPVVFKSMPNAADGRIIAGTRLGAQISERPEPVMFETESGIAMAAAQLVEVKTLWPARDEYADHSTSLAGGRPFTLFKSAGAVPHKIYIAHDTFFAFAGKATVEIEFELTTPGGIPLQIIWEYWDGQVWRPFKRFDPEEEFPSQDITDGLTRSGVVRLRAECGQSEKTTINGINAYWVRGRLENPLPPDPAQVLPMVDRIRVRTVIERPILFVHPGAFCREGLQPDRAFAAGSRLDLSSTFLPFGQSPGFDSIFYFACEEVFSKPGAVAEICIRRVETPEEKADTLGSKFEFDVNQARQAILNAAREAAQTIINSAESIIELDKEETTTSDLIINRDLLKAAKDDLATTNAIKDLAEAANDVVEVMNGIIFGVRDNEISRFHNQDVIRGGNLNNIGNRILNAGEESSLAASAALHILNSLSDLSPEEALSVEGVEQPVLTPPQLVWEYWDGHRWQVISLTGDDRARNFLGEFGLSSKLTFIVPEDFEEVTVNEVRNLWIRVRLAGGSYNRLRLVSWYDTQSERINFFPIIEPRPPALEAFFLGYTYRSPWDRPEDCITYSDFQFEIHSRDVHWPGGFFPPFRPVADTTPALYLGFDRPLLNDLVSIYLDIQESEIVTPPLVWEGWDGKDWRELSVTDETANLRQPGMVSFIAPDVAPRPEATVKQVGDSKITMSSPLATAVFQPGDQVVIRQNDTGEMATVQQVDGDGVLLETPLSNTYTGGTVRQAALPRFGTPRDWVRARLKQDGAPTESRVNGIYLNAAWAVQVQTINDEVLGSGTDHPNQTLFLTQTPVLPGERIEVRELEGARAEVELPILQEELLKRGRAADDIRPVFDPRTGHVSEVWVRWQSRPHLFFSGPDDRHYVVERARGRLIFGDGRYGRMPTVSANNILARRYQAGGGVAGNVPAGAITQLLGLVPFVQEVINPRSADGGAEGEMPAAVKRRGPETLRHRYRSLAARDYEALAREASPGVAAAQTLPATAPNGRPAPGWVTVIIVPQSQDPQPQPSFELRRQVHDYLTDRAPATVSVGRIAVIGPTYLPIGVAASVVPRDPDEAGGVEDRVQTALASLLHPLAGGPDGCGWPFGRDVYLSDVAAVLEAVEGVDYVEELNLLLNDSPQGERVEVPPDRIVVAGPIRIQMEAAERRP